MLRSNCRRSSSHSSGRYGLLLELLVNPSCDQRYLNRDFDYVGFILSPMMLNEY